MSTGPASFRRKLSPVTRKKAWGQRAALTIRFTFFLFAPPSRLFGFGPGYSRARGEGGIQAEQGMLQRAT